MANKTKAKGSAQPPIEDVLSTFESLRELYQLERFGLSPIPTGFEGLDRLLAGGFTPGSLNLLAPFQQGNSATAFALSLARRAGHFLPALYVSTTHPRSELVLALLAATSVVPIERLWQGELTQQELDEVRQALHELRTNQHLAFQAEPNLNLPRLREVLIRTLKGGQRPPSLIVVDTVQLLAEMPLTYAWQDERELHGAEIMASLKRLALEFEVALLAVYRLPRHTTDPDKRRVDWRKVGWSIELDALLELAPFSSPPEKQNGEGSASQTGGEDPRVPGASFHEIKVWRSRGVAAGQQLFHYWPTYRLFEEVEAASPG